MVNTLLRERPKMSKIIIQLNENFPVITEAAFASVTDPDQWTTTDLVPCIEPGNLAEKDPDSEFTWATLHFAQHTISAIRRVLPELKLDITEPIIVESVKTDSNGLVTEMVMLPKLVEYGSIVDLDPALPPWTDFIAFYSRMQEEGACTLQVID
jgi:hypothetical protein